MNEPIYEVLLLQDGGVVDRIAVCNGIRSAILHAIMASLHSGKIYAVKFQEDKAPFFETGAIVKVVTAADLIYGRKEF